MFSDGLYITKHKGTMDIADINDDSIQKTMVNPSGAKNCPISPFINPRGRKTTQVVMVEPRTDSPTVFTESRAAVCLVFKPAVEYFSMDLKQASSTTMELSTIIPTPRTSEDMVTMLREYPIAHMATRAVSMEIGIEVPTIRDAFRSPKNSIMMIMEMMMAMIMVSNTDVRELKILSEASSIIWILRFSSLASSSAIRFLACFDILTADSLCFFVRSSMMVSSPLYLPMAS